MVNALYGHKFVQPVEL